jgi:hypothetical protein
MASFLPCSSARSALTISLFRSEKKGKAAAGERAIYYYTAFNYAVL